MIWSDIASDSIRAADRMVDKITSLFDELAEMPGIGTLQPEVGPQVLRHVVRPDLIFYRPIESGVGILRVLHDARDLPPILKRMRDE